MTGKRFKLIGDSNLEMLMQHQLKLPIYDYDNKKKKLSLNNTLNLLNSLYEENKQLKQTIQDMQIRFKRKYDHEFDDIVDELD